jgi:hypothetical protein
MTAYRFPPSTTLPSVPVSVQQAKRQQVLEKAAQTRRANYLAFLKKHRLHVSRDLATIG